MNPGLLRRPDVLMVIASAPAYVATSKILETVHPLDLTPLRFLVSALLLGMYFLATKRKFMLRRRDAPKVFAAVVLGYGAYITLLNIAQTTVPAGTTSLLLNTAPVFAFALAHVFLGERTSRLGLAGLAIAVLGTAAVTVFGTSTLGFDWNSLLVLAAALVLAVFLTVQQPFFRTIPPAEMVFWGCLVSGLATLPMARFELPASAWTPATVGSLAVLIVVSTVVACVLWNKSLAATSVAAGGSLLFAIPVFSVLLGWLLLDQVPSPAAVVGGAVALLGVVLLGRAQSVKPRPAFEVAA